MAGRRLGAQHNLTVRGAAPAPQGAHKGRHQRMVKGFVDAAKHALRTGFDVIEAPSVHGYLISSFLSPTSNDRTDECSGSFENCALLMLEVVHAVHVAILPTMLLLFLAQSMAWICLSCGEAVTIPHRRFRRGLSTRRTSRRLRARMDIRAKPRCIYRTHITW